MSHHATYMLLIISFLPCLSNAGGHWLCTNTACAKVDPSVAAVATAALPDAAAAAAIDAPADDKNDVDPAAASVADVADVNAAADADDPPPPLPLVPPVLLALLLLLLPGVDAGKVFTTTGCKSAAAFRNRMKGRFADHSSVTKTTSQTESK